MHRKPLRFVLPLVLLAAIIAAAIVIVRATEAASAAEPDPASLPATAAEVATNVAKYNGDSTPEKIEFALTTPDKYASTMDAVSTDTTSKNYAIVMRGDFTMYTAHLPVGVEPPHADWIMLIIDPNDGTVLGMSASTGTPDTTAMGTMTPVTLPAESAQ